jgi:hypothetical protein
MNLRVEDVIPAVVTLIVAWLPIGNLIYKFGLLRAQVDSNTKDIMGIGTLLDNMHLRDGNELERDLQRIDKRQNDDHDDLQELKSDMKQVKYMLNLIIKKMNIEMPEV